MCSTNQKRMICLVSAVMVLTLVGVLIAPTAFARIAQNTIDLVAVVTDNGRHVTVTGPISCTGSQPAYVRVTVTQRSTGAVAEGSTHVACTADVQQWEVDASTQGKATFEEGPATAVVLARTTVDRGDSDDAHQWLPNTRWSESKVERHQSALWRLTAGWSPTLAKLAGLTRSVRPLRSAEHSRMA